MSTIRIDVTAEDIQRGRPRDMEHCPVACAMSRVLKTGVEVAHSTWLGGRFTVAYSLPTEVMVRIAKYDLTEQMQPFSFDVQVPR